MSTNLFCFLLGIPATLIWFRGLKNGVMLGLIFGFVHRTGAPGRFWLCSAFYGVLACGLLAAPITSWVGLRG